MKKTTVYLTDELRAGVKRVAAARGVSEAEVIRVAIQGEVETARPAPRGGLFSDPDIQAANTDEMLAGFGES